MRYILSSIYTYSLLFILYTHNEEQYIWLPTVNVSMSNVLPSTYTVHAECVWMSQLIQLFFPHQAQSLFASV